MDQLRLCMNVLRLVARQPARADRQLLLQRQINGYLRREAADPRAAYFVAKLWAEAIVP
jgi:hypothetical protein